LSHVERRVQAGRVT
jgi:hypothetical protein